MSGAFPAALGAAEGALQDSAPGVRRREAEKRAISVDVFRVMARSASISPTTEENLNPCPEKPAAMLTCGYRGWASMRKCSSGVMVYMQVTARETSPFNAGI